MLPKSQTSFFNALVPKFECPLALRDFRPISLLSSLYKLVDKVLSSRLERVMWKLISLEKSASQGEVVGGRSGCP